MRTEIKYKVVDTMGYSAVMQGAARTEYRKDKYVTLPEWLRKKGYYPFVFGNINEAIIFAKYHRGLVFEARVKGHHRKVKMPKYLGVFSLGYGFMVKSKGWFPDGTEMWEYVKLIREIK